MKFASLELLAYGACTDAKIDFRTDAKVHIIVGPNEVGKSTRRAAVCDFLYGFEHRSDYAFNHKPPRIGATLEIAGSRHRLIRKKMRKDSLQDDVGAVVGDELLRSALHDFNRQTFEDIFSISQQELKKGAEILLQSDGDAAKALFGAATGGLNVQALVEELSERAAAIYKQRASTPRLNVAIADFNCAKDRQVTDTVDAASWEQLETTLRDLEQQTEALADDIASLNTLHERYMRYDQNKKIIIEYKETKSFLAHFEGLRFLTDQAYAESKKLIERITLCEQEENKAADEIKKLQDEIQKTTINQRLLESYDECVEVSQQAHTIRDARKDVRTEHLDRLPELEVSLSQAANGVWAGLEIREICERIDGFTSEVLAQARDTITKYTELSKKWNESHAQVVELHEALEAHRGQALALQDAQNMQDDDLLEATTTAAERTLTVEADIVQLSAEIAEATNALAHRLLAMGLVLDDPLACRAIPLPSRDVVKTFERRSAEAHREQTMLSENLSIAREAMRNAQREVNDFSDAKVLVTEEVLHASRMRRDEMFGLIAGTTQDTRSPILLSVECLIHEADRFADQRFSQAERLEKYATSQRSLEKSSLLFENQVKECEEARLAISRIEQEWEEWCSQFLRLGKTPDELLGSLDRLERCIPEADRIAKSQSRLDQLRMQEHKLSSDLRLALHCSESHYSFGVLLERAKAKRKQIQAEKMQAQLGQSRLQDATKKWNAAQSRCEEYRNQLEQYKQQWYTTLELLHFSPTIKHEVALGLFDRIVDLRVKVRDFLRKHRRKAELETKERAFRNAVERLLARCAPDLLVRYDENDIDAITTLRHNADQTYKHHAQMQGHLKLIHHRESEMAGITSEHKESRIRLSAILKAEDFFESELDELLKRHQLRDDRLASFRALERDLLIATRQDAVALTDEIESLGGYAILEPKLGRLHDDLHHKQEKYRELLQNRGVLEAQRKEAQASLKAVNAEAELMSIGADIDRLAREYATLVAATTILEDRAQSYAAAHQGPVVTQASAYFRSMTLGAYAEVRVTEGENGVALLSVIDERNEGKSVDALSEGTRDQLYLALRLATIVERLGADQGPPLLLDDTLRAFDDRRLLAAFETLAQFSQHAQVIYFTPRSIIADLARQALGDGADIINLSSAL